MNVWIGLPVAAFITVALILMAAPVALGRPRCRPVSRVIHYFRSRAAVPSARLVGVVDPSKQAPADKVWRSSRNDWDALHVASRLHIDGNGERRGPVSQLPCLVALELLESGNRLKPSSGPSPARQTRS